MNVGIRLAPVLWPICETIIAVSGMIETDPELFVKECRRCHSLISMRYDQTTRHTIVEEVKPN
jgi:hypothetical protein